MCGLRRKSLVFFSCGSSHEQRGQSIREKEANTRDLSEADERPVMSWEEDVDVY